VPAGKAVAGGGTHEDLGRSAPPPSTRHPPRTHGPHRTPTMAARTPTTDPNHRPTATPTTQASPLRTHQPGAHRGPLAPAHRTTRPHSPCAGECAATPTTARPTLTMGPDHAGSAPQWADHRAAAHTDAWAPGIGPAGRRGRPAAQCTSVPITVRSRLVRRAQRASSAQPAVAQPVRRTRTARLHRPRPPGAGRVQLRTWASPTATVRVPAWVSVHRPGGHGAAGRSAKVRV
jgi:hypothetical protein